MAVATPATSPRRSSLSRSFSPSPARYCRTDQERPRTSPLRERRRRTCRSVRGRASPPGVRRPGHPSRRRHRRSGRGRPRCGRVRGARQSRPRWHRLAGTDPISLNSLENETLLLFPRELAPAYYDRIIAAFEESGFEPRIVSFADPPPQAMLARLQAGREVGLPPASLGSHAAGAQSGLIARKIAQPGIVAEWSILWAARAPSAAVGRFLESARRCADENHWLRSPKETTGAENDAPSPAPL